MTLGFIHLYRNILEWEWYTDINTKTLFIHCLLKCNFKDKKWRNILIKKGSFITSYNNLSKETGLSIQSVRTSLNKLKSTNELTIKSTNKNSLITITKWDLYNNTNTQTNNQLTNNQHATNTQLTTTNKDNKDNKDNNENKYIEITEELRNSYYKKQGYEFLGYVIKLKKKDFKVWRDKRRDISFLQFCDVLIKRDYWLSKQDEKKQKNWFISTSKYLEGGKK